MKACLNFNFLEKILEFRVKCKRFFAPVSPFLFGSLNTFKEETNLFIIVLAMHHQWIIRSLHVHQVKVKVTTMIANLIANPNILSPVVLLAVSNNLMVMKRLRH